MYKLVFPLLLGLAMMTGFAAADSIDYSTGAFQSGSLLGSFSGSINVTIAGSLNTIDVITGMLVKTTVGCPMDSTCFDFANGSVKVSNSSGTVFFDSLSGGIAIEENGAASLQAELTTGHGITVGNATATFNFSGSALSTGSADVSLQRSVVTPEPGMLLLFGTGLVGVAARQKFRGRSLAFLKRSFVSNASYPVS